MRIHNIKSYAIRVFRQFKYTKKQQCVDCHFFMKEDPRRNPPRCFVISHEDREKTRNQDFSWLKDPFTIACDFKVWDERAEFDKSKRYQVLVETDRRHFCFFWKYRPGMGWLSAKILQEREAAQREARRDRRLTLIGLWIAALALVANVIMQFFEK